MRTWPDEMKQRTDELRVFFIVANQIDLADERRVPPEQGQGLATELNGFLL
jgi:hypothetical protein